MADEKKTSDWKEMLGLPADMVDTPAMIAANRRVDEARERLCAKLEAIVNESLARLPEQERLHRLFIMSNFSIHSQN
jgi:hypothetical protein